VAAADWDSIAKKEHLDSLTVEMRKLEGTIREVYNEMIQLQQREQELRDLNGELRIAQAQTRHCDGQRVSDRSTCWQMQHAACPVAACSSQPDLIGGATAAVPPPRADWHACCGKEAMGARSCVQQL
jgi:hypothetical protein